MTFSLRDAWEYPQKVRVAVALGLFFQACNEYAEQVDFERWKKRFLESDPEDCYGVNEQGMALCAGCDEYLLIESEEFLLCQTCCNAMREEVSADEASGVEDQVSSFLFVQLPLPFVERGLFIC